MYEWQDILIVGDSFCQHRYSANTWPYRLLCLLTKQNNGKPPRGKGFPGASWWSTRKNLLSEFKINVPKVLIICHTEYNRLPNDYDFGLNVVSAEYDVQNFDQGNLYSVEENNKNFNLYSKDIAQSAVLYYKYLNSLEFNYWSRNMWFDELESLYNSLRIEKVIHLHSFYDYIQNQGMIFPRVFKNALTAQEILWENCNDKEIFSKENLNHFSIEKNIKIADNIYDHITNYRPGIFSLKLSEQ